MRSSPLPRGILLLLRLAAEEADALSEAEKADKRARDAHRDAAIFFIEQILLAANSDAYRVLGLDETATPTERRRHMVYLLKWLHPDRHGDPHKARLARRVLLAWNELKSTRRSSDCSSSTQTERRSRRVNNAMRAPPAIVTTRKRTLYLRWFIDRKRLRARFWSL
ncbi:MAG: J domain-containing protein [Proteobacteria bacterium]|nr:J domain-containing protein [Pseudomonadota bacterium]